MLPRGAGPRRSGARRGRPRRVGRRRQRGSPSRPVARGSPTQAERPGRRTRRARGAAGRARPRTARRSGPPRSTVARAPGARARSSRGSPEYRRAQRELGEEERDTKGQEGELRLLVVDEVARADVGLFQRLDLAVDLGERVLIGDAVVMASGVLGDLAHELLVDGIGADVLVGGRGESDRTDRVDADVEELRHVRRVEWRDVSAVVLAVGQEDDDLRLRVRVSKHVDAGGETRADRRAPGERAGLDRIDELLRSGVVERRRAEDDRLAAEDDDPHAVIPKAAEEVVDDALDGVDLRRPAESSFGHRPGCVENQDDVYPFRDGLDRRAHDLRPGEGDDECDEGRNAKGDEQPAPAHAPAGPTRGDETDRRKEQAGPGSPRPQEIHREAPGYHEEECEKPWVLEAERGDVDHDGWPFMSSYCSATAARRMASSADRTACCARAG